MNLSILKKLGLSDKEILVYTALLKSGSSSVRNIATKTEINRGTVYDVLKKLQEMGLVSYFHIKTKQKFVAENPDNLLKVLEDQENSLKKAKNNLSNLVPQLKSLQNKDNLAPVTKYYEGKQGIKMILDDVLISFDEVDKNIERKYFVYSAEEASIDINNAYPDYTKKRIKKEISVQVISLAKGGSPKGFDERKWLGIDNKSATFIIIYQNKCAFISRDVMGKSVGVIIENKMIYQTQKDIFLQLWEFLK